MLTNILNKYELVFVFDFKSCIYLLSIIGNRPVKRQLAQFIDDNLICNFIKLGQPITEKNK